jgi:hypothetical protein
MRPGPEGFGPSTGSGDIVGASSSSKTRSAEATPDCSTFAIDPSWASGWVNWREYCTNACTPPMVRVPPVTIVAPTTATAT